jgi:hypothetical protein
MKSCFQGELQIKYFKARDGKLEKEPSIETK